jgi:putative restriction endonuclease
MISGMRAYVGVTDGDWYRFLAARPEMTEANFWRPQGDRAFHALTIGEPFFFKTHRPHDRVVGGGFYSGFARLRVSEAWAMYAEANGVADLDAMRRRIGHYRRRPLGVDEDPFIGCIFVRDTGFFPQGGAADPPQDFAPNVVQGKSYDMAAEPARGYFQELLNRLLGTKLDVISDDADLTAAAWAREGPVYSDPRLVPQRLGQRAFQAVVLEAYSRRCAVTGDKIVPVLQAAHIRPLPAGGEHRLDNGMLLRSDVHTLFDRGYLAVDPKHRLLVSPRLRHEFGNGEEFYARAREAIDLPERRVDRPNPEFLEWHVDCVFRAS